MYFVMWLGVLEQKFFNEFASILRPTRTSKLRIDDLHSRL